MYKKYFNNKKAVFFDFDGTLVDTSDMWDEAYQKVLGQLEEIAVLPDLPSGLSMTEKWTQILRYNDLRTKFTVKQLGEYTDKAFIAKFTKYPIPVNDGFENLVYKLKEEKNMKLGLVSNSSAVVVDSVLKKLGIFERFDFIVTSDQVSKPKPAPDIYKLALKKAGLKSKDVLAFEDSLVGVQSALNANIDTFAVLVNDSLTPKDYPKKVKAVVAGLQDLHLYVDTDFQDELNDAVTFAETYYRPMPKEVAEKIAQRMKELEEALRS